MPDHLHLLVQGRSEHSDLIRFATAAKQRTAYRYKQETGRSLWQAGWFDHQLQVRDDVAEAIEYIAMNPVRAGLVATASDYPFSGGTAIPPRDPTPTV